MTPAIRRRGTALVVSAPIFALIAYLYLLPTLNGTNIVNNGEATIEWILRGEAAQSIKLGILPLWDPLSGLGGDLSSFIFRIPIDHIALAQLLGGSRESIFFFVVVVALASFLIAASVIFREGGIAFHVLTLTIFPYYFHILYGFNDFASLAHTPLYIAYLLLGAMFVHLERGEGRSVQWKIITTAIAIYSLAGVGQQLHVWGFIVPVSLALLTIAHRLAYGVPLVQPRRDLAYFGIYACGLLLNSWAIAYHATEAFDSFRMVGRLEARMPATEVAGRFLESLVKSAPLLVTAIYVCGACLLLLFRREIRDDDRTRTRILTVLGAAAIFMVISGAWADVPRDLALTDYWAVNYALGIGYFAILGTVFLLPSMRDRVPRALVVLPLLHFVACSALLENLEGTKGFHHLIRPAAALLLFASVFLSVLHKNLRLSIFVSLNTALLVFIRSYAVVIFEYGLHVPWPIDRDSSALSFALAMLMLVGLHAVITIVPQRSGRLASLALAVIFLLAAASLRMTFIEERTGSVFQPGNISPDGHWSGLIMLTARGLVRQGLYLEPSQRPPSLLIYNPSDAPIVQPGAFRDLGIVSLDYYDSLFLETGSRVIREMPRLVEPPSRFCLYSITLWHTLNVSKSDPCSLQDRVRSYLSRITTNYGFDERSIAFAQQHVDPDLVLVVERPQLGAPVVGATLRTKFRLLSERSIEGFKLSMWRSKEKWRVPVRLAAVDPAVKSNALGGAAAMASEAFVASYYAVPLLKQGFSFAFSMPSDGYAEVDIAYSSKWRWSVNGVVLNARETPEGMTRIPLTAGRNAIDAVFFPGLGSWLIMCMVGIAISVFAAIGLWLKRGR